jgi:hypothetical protein
VRNAWRNGVSASVCFFIIGFSPVRAFAERVVLVRPNEELPQLTEIYNRLQGELKMHGFEAIFASAQGTATFVEMQRLATLAQAEACVAIEIVDGTPTVNLWFLEHSTKSARTFSFTGGDDAEFATVLPLRTVELLRSDASERQDTSRDSVQKAPLAAPKKSQSKPVREREPRRVGETRRSFSARVATGPKWGALGVSPSLDAELSMGRRLNSSFELALLTTVPLTELSLSGTGATAHLRSYQFGAEVRFSHPVFQRRFFFECASGLSAAYVRATATTESQWSPRNSTGWSAVAHLGGGAWFGINSRFSIGATLRFGITAPRPVIEVAERRQTLGRPEVTAMLGVNAEF